MKIPPPPTGTNPAGRHLWRSVLTSYVLAEHEVTLLRQAVRTPTSAPTSRPVVDAEGVMATTRLGDIKIHPAVGELRQQRLTLARLLVALRVPLGEQEAQTPTAAPSATVARFWPLQARPSPPQRRAPGVEEPLSGATAQAAIQLRAIPPTTIGKTTS